ncbi:MAG: glutathione S-transferase N-terminal domain-containing protein [Gaiellaceae bacterium]|jgi:glutathione S-transferase
MERVHLIGIPGSHPVLAVQEMLEYKGIPYVRRDLPNQLHRPLLRLRGYHGRTVPVARIAGRRVEGSRAITRALDELQPERPLLPADPALRARVEELERWADEEFQHTARELAHWGASRDRASLRTFATPSYLPLPPWLVQALLPLITPLILAGFRVDDQEARACLAALPAQLDRVDAAVAEGLLDGSAPNAADFQVAATVGLLDCFDDLRPHVEPRPAGALARRLAPDYAGRIGPVFPPEWLQPLE